MNKNGVRMTNELADIKDKWRIARNVEKKIKNMDQLFSGEPESVPEKAVTKYSISWLKDRMKSV